MSFSRINRAINARAFTLVEVMIAASVFTVVGTALLSLMISTLQLSSANAVTNMSNYRARQTLDRVGELIRYAQETPVLINADGTPATGTTSDGVLVKNSLGGPYVFKNSNGQTDDIPSGATSFMVEYAPAANVAAPAVGDYFLLNTSKRPELEVLSVTPAAPVGAISRVQITTRTPGITEIAQPSSYTVSAVRFRKEAYVFVQKGTQWNLQYYSSVIPTTSYTDPTAYGVLGTGFQKLANQAWFTAVINAGTEAFWLRAVARSSDHAEYVELVKGQNTLTAMPVQSKIWNYNAPPPN